MTKFSVLLPTRNRLDLLRYAVESVLRQDYQDWELVISDNDSAEDIRGYAASLADPRIIYVRTDAFIPVTDNWNNALTHSSGDMIVMLGDDDCLMTGYFSTIERLLKIQPDADFVYTSALLYAYPGVVPGHPQGFLRSYARSSFLRGMDAPFWLEREAAHRLVAGFLRFRVDFDFNMQFFAISRHLIRDLSRHGPFFQSPFPDYYAANAMMLVSKRILVCPLPLVTIGISPKSFGYYYFNGKEELGAEFLKDLPDPQMAEELRHLPLPGSHLFTSWLFSAETLCARLGGEFPLRVDRHRYRQLQVRLLYRSRWLDGTADQGVIARLWRRLTWMERLTQAMPLSIWYRLRASIPGPLRRCLGDTLRWFRRSRAAPAVPPVASPQFATIREVFTTIDPSALPPLPSTGD